MPPVAVIRVPAPSRSLSRDVVYASRPRRGLERVLSLRRSAPGATARGARLHVFGSSGPGSPTRPAQSF